MQLDVRLPMGVMFLIIGVILVVYGLITWTNAELYARSLNCNVNVWWGLFLTAFGALMLWLTRRAAQSQQETSPPPE